MLIKLTKPQIKTLRLALYLAAEWENSLIDANRMDYPPGKWCDAKSVRKCKSNVSKFNALRSSLYQCIKGEKPMDDDLDAYFETERQIMQVLKRRNELMSPSMKIRFRRFINKHCISFGFSIDYGYTKAIEFTFLFWTFDISIERKINR